MVVVVSGLLLAASNCFAVQGAGVSRSGTAGKLDSTSKSNICSPQTKQISGCAIRFVIPPPQIIVGTSSIKIDGVKLPVSVREYMVKNALHRPWSTSSEDRGLIVCRWASSFRGSRIKDRIRCESNEGHAWAAKNTQETFGAGAGATTSCATAPTVTAGLVGVSSEMAACIMSEVGKWVNTQYPSRIVSGMSKLPGAGNDYTIKIKEKGQVTSEWIFEKGRLVAVWHKRQTKAKGHQGG